MLPVFCQPHTDVLRLLPVFCHLPKSPLKTLPVFCQSHTYVLKLLPVFYHLPKSPLKTLPVFCQPHADVLNLLHVFCQLRTDVADEVCDVTYFSGGSYCATSSVNEKLRSLLVTV